LKQLQENVGAIDRQAAELQAEMERLRAALAAQPRPAARKAAALSKEQENARTDGQKFLATFPQARGMLVEISRVTLGRNLAGFYRFADLTPAQIAELEKRTTEFLIENIAVSPKGIKSTEQHLPEEQLRQILGDDGFRRFSEYPRVKPAYELAVKIGMVTGLTGTPLNREQSDQFVETVLRHSSIYQNGGTVMLDTVNWSAAATEIKTTLTPEQWQMTESALLELQFRQAVLQARVPKSTGSEAKAKS
jgi:hypothetical protein